MLEQKTFNLMEVVGNEFQDGYDREWGLGIITSWDIKDGMWIYVVHKLYKDEQGYFMNSDYEVRTADRLRKTKYSVDEINVLLQTPSKPE
jgi:hypothetical protein